MRRLPANIVHAKQSEHEIHLVRAMQLITVRDTLLCSAAPSPVVRRQAFTACDAREVDVRSFLGVCGDGSIDQHRKETRCRRHVQPQSTADARDGNYKGGSAIMHLGADAFACDTRATGRPRPDGASGSLLRW